MLSGGYPSGQGFTLSLSLSPHLDSFVFIILMVVYLFFSSGGDTPGSLGLSDRRKTCQHLLSILLLSVNVPLSSFGNSCALFFSHMQNSCDLVDLFLTLCPPSSVHLCRSCVRLQPRAPHRLNGCWGGNFLGLDSLLLVLPESSDHQPGPTVQTLC